MSCTRVGTYRTAAATLLEDAHAVIARRQHEDGALERLGEDTHRRKAVLAHFASRGCTETQARDPSAMLGYALGF